MTVLLDARGLIKLYPIRRGLRRQYLHAVDGVDLSIDQGQCVGLVGESGCGKSTLARLVAKLIEPTSGAIVFDGAEMGATPLRTFASSQMRAAIQAVFQDPHESLNPSFTAFDAVADPARTRAPLSPSIIGRTKGEGGDRARDRRRSAPYNPGRADLRARRLGAIGDSEAAG
jgi:ABC-type oligopeptide transport system ATPase subunit